MTRPWRCLRERPDQYACFRPPFISAARTRNGGVADRLDEAKAAFRAAGERQLSERDST
jgi:hypothetical protein